VGVERADGRYIAFLDDDDLFMPGHLASGCEALRSGAADFVYLAAAVADRRLQLPSPDLSGLRRKAYPFDHRLLMVANYLHTGSVIVRNFRDTTIRFDEALDVCEDWDLWLALTKLGYRVCYVDEVTSVYHQLPDVVGLVAGAQLVSPSRFAVAREYIEAKWPTTDPLVVAYRRWMTALETVRSALIARERRMPNLLFDDILAYLHHRVTREQPAEYGDIQRFFAPATGM
jgi:glycosyltransferase involved in cell wall biosynthesis